MKIAVIGAGGIGGYFGARWADAGHDVTFVARGEHLKAIQRNGITVYSGLGDVSTRARAVATPSEVGVVDHVLLATKAWQLPDALSTVAPLIGDHTTVLGLQNGVTASDTIATAVGEGHVLSGTCRIISFIEAPGVIRHAGGAPIIFLGETRGGESARATELGRELARGSGMTVEAVANIQLEIWKKLHWFAPLAGVGSVTRSAAGVFRSIPQSRQMLKAAMDEVAALSNRMGVTLPSDSTDRALDFVDALPADATSSMMRDFRDGKRTELDTLCGGVVRMAEQVGLAVPVHAFLYAALLPQELVARGEN